MNHSVDIDGCGAIRRRLDDIGACLEHLPDAQQIAIGINDGKFPQSPRLDFESIHARDTFLGKLRQRKSLVHALNVENPDVATER